MNTKKMTNKELRDYVANQCGYNPSTNKAQLAAERLGLSNKAKTQPQRLLESILPTCEVLTFDKAKEYWDKRDKMREAIFPPRNAFPTIEDQQRYWQERDENLDKIESNALWFDNKAKTEIPF